MIVDNKENIYIGLPDEVRENISGALSRMLADTYSLYVMTQNYHWNIKGKSFVTLHKLFATQYKDLAEAIDEIAERISMLGFKSPGSFKEFSDLTVISQDNGASTKDEMIHSLLSAHESIIRTARSLVNVSDAYKDYATSELVTKRILEHEKAAWELRSLLSRDVS